MHDTLHQLFRYKAWANDTLLSALARLGSDSAVTGLAIKALSHTHIVDRIFAAHLRRKAHVYTSANASQMPTLPELSAELRKSDQAYIDYVSTLARDDLAERIDFVFTDGARGCMSREEMLMHVVNHGTGHRGQISAVMLLNGVAPVKDGFTTYLQEARQTTQEQTAT